MSNYSWIFTTVQLKSQNVPSFVILHLIWLVRNRPSVGASGAYLLQPKQTKQGKLLSPILKFGWKKNTQQINSFWFCLFLSES